MEIIARDRGGGYATGSTRGRPDAIRVADPWHLMENASASFLMAVRRCMKKVRRALGAGAIAPATLTAAERLQHEGCMCRVEAEAAVRALHAAGVPIKEIVRRTGRSRKLMREVSRGCHAEPFRPRASSLEPWLSRLSAEWADGCRNGAELWRRLRAAGFAGPLRVVTEWATRHRRDDASADPTRCPAPRALARLIMLARDRLSRAEAVIVAIVERAVPRPVAAREAVDGFHALIRGRDPARLETWLEAAMSSPVGAFARGVAADRDAIEAAIALPWSSGQTEGRISRLKRVKRQMGRRANIDLLRARLMPIP